MKIGRASGTSIAVFAVGAVLTFALERRGGPIAVNVAP